jgi:hypothetical protein
VGLIPQEIGSLTELKKIEIRESNLSGGQVPESIGLCTQLTDLILYECKLQGEFPVGIRELKSLGIQFNSNEKRIYIFTVTTISQMSFTLLGFIIINLPVPSQTLFASSCN